MGFFIETETFSSSYRENSLWSFSHNSLSFDPIHSDFDVNGVQFQWQDGIFSIQLSNRNPDGFKTAYFHAMASTSEFAVSTEILRNQTLVSRSYHGDDFRVRLCMEWNVLDEYLYLTNFSIWVNVRRLDSLQRMLMTKILVFFSIHK